MATGMKNTNGNEDGDDNNLRPRVASWGSGISVGISSGGGGDGGAGGGCMDATTKTTMLGCPRL